MKILDTIKAMFINWIKGKIKKLLIVIGFVFSSAFIFILYLIFIHFISSCGVPPEDWQNTHLEKLEDKWMASMDASMEKWIDASQYLPREQLQGLQSAGFFEIGDIVYSHHCDSHGNMIRLRFDEESKTWKKIKYETLGCGYDE